VNGIELINGHVKPFTVNPVYQIVSQHEKQEPHGQQHHVYDRTPGEKGSNHF